MPEHDTSAKRTIERGNKPPESRPAGPELVPSPGLEQAILDIGQASPAEVLQLQRLAGNRAVTGLIAPAMIPGVQPRLMVGPADDHYEREAERVAEQVLHAPEPGPPQAAPVQRQEEEEIQTRPLATSITPLVQRQEDEEEIQTRPLVQRQEDEEEIQTRPLVQRQEDEEEIQTRSLIQRQEEEEIQTRAACRPGWDESFEAGPEIERRLAASKGGAARLPDSVRAFMEPRFGADFDNVRVHTGSDAVQMNRDLRAQAFTHGQDIYFGAAQYDPGSDAGKKLLAHELAHVVQQVPGEVRPQAGAAGAPGVQRKGPTWAGFKSHLPRMATLKKGATRAGRVGLAVVAPTSALQDFSMATPSTGKKVGLGIGKAGLGVLEGIAKLLLGPLTYLRFFHAKQRQGLADDTVKADYGGGPVAIAAKTLATITKAIEEVGMVAAWIGLIAGIVGAAIGAATMGASGAAGAAVASVCGIIALSCAAWSFIARTILMIGNIVRLGKYHGWSGKEIKVQIFKDGMGILSSIIGIVTGGLGAGNVSIAGMADASYGPSVGKVLAETGVGQASAAPADALVEGLQTRRIQRQAGLPDDSALVAPQGQDAGPSPEDLQAVAEAGDLAREIGALGRGEQQLTKKEKANVGEVSAAVQETLPQAQKGLGPILGLGEQVEEASQQANQLDTLTGNVDREENAEPDTVQEVESATARAKQAAARDPKDIKPQEVQQLGKQVRGMSPGQKKSFARRAGGAIKHLFAALFRRLAGAKKVIQSLMARIKNKLVQIVLKATGAEAPAMDFMGGLQEAKDGIPRERQVLEDKEAAAGGMADLADQVAEVTKG